MTETTYWRVPKPPAPLTWFIVAGGPSLMLMADQLQQLRGHRVIVINDSYQLCPWADYLYFCDRKWWEWHRVRSGYRAFEGDVVKLEPAVQEDRVRVLRNTGASGLETEPDGLRTGQNSGYQAMNLAFHLGGKRLVLLGYDMKNMGEQCHWFGNHPSGNKSDYTHFCQMFETIKGPLASHGVEVINATPGSALECFPRGNLADLL